MNDMTVTSKMIVEGIWALQDQEKMVTRARMKFKPAKPGHLVLNKGKMKGEKFKIGDVAIPTITEKAVKSFGKCLPAPSMTEAVSLRCGPTQGNG